ncbi:xanthine dehydrogenase family protein molybdopterin-binding subunit [Seonamhaeicola marinus]|uniref:Xanthine dehydrogenase family protein molybdopterin-binding subunit n=1 Tax=Seonamhaeicola marinus TaxID=1912246 RepID=A0A5D0I780_9FLAO|nr:molybdopterin cofactor-binding domain-containing protein [Seonamhaeicola marinus]TYA78720.1 xanthine dehydrogenase family protein molybdopterin-binding subunit [Seonamhaeicola marinus]
MLSRRRFIQLTGIAGGGLTIGIGLMNSCEENVKLSRYNIPKTKNRFSGSYGHYFGEYIQIRKDGEIFINVIKHEMGQGIASGLVGIVADELDADWKKVHIVYSDPIPDMGNSTGGSVSTIKEWYSMRNVGAFARNLFIETAANIWSVSKDICYTKNHKVLRIGSDDEFEFGELVDQVQFPENTDLAPPLKKAKDFKYIGKSFSNKTTPDIIQGKHPYAIDVKLEGMKYASIERAPVFGGTLIDYDSTHVLEVPGVEKVVTIKGMVLDNNSHIRDGIAVIANSTWAAIEGRKLLKATWKDGEKSLIEHKTFLNDAYDIIEGDEKGYTVLAKGNLNALEKADQIITHTYEFPYQHHACMEPLNAIAKYSGTSCELWTGTQSADRIITNIEKKIGLKPKNIKLHCHPSGGGFGLRYFAEHSLEALLVSKACDGDLIKLMYTREDDIKFDYLNPLEINKHSVGIKDGKITSWHLRGVVDNWGGVLGWMIYDIPNRHAEHFGVKGFTQMSAWRSVMANAEGFSTESFIDEVAIALKKDPLEFRLSLLKKGEMVTLNHNYKCNINRIRNALITVARKAKWGKKMPDGWAQGIAVYPYMHGNGYAAAVAEVSTNNNSIKVEKIYIALECGLVINPDFVTKQMEGGVIWALSAFFYGGTEYKAGVVQRSNFHDNQVLRINEVPEIDVCICKSDETEPWGVGEIAGPVTYPAVSNAIFAATGKRIRKLPFTNTF